MTIDDVLKRLRIMSDRHARRVQQFADFAGKIQPSFEAVNGAVGDVLVAGTLSQDKFQFTFFGKDYQYRLCTVVREPRSKIILERVAPPINGERESVPIIAIFLDSSGNVFTTVNANSAALAIVHVNDVFFLFIQHLEKAAEEIPQE